MSLSPHGALPQPSRTPQRMAVASAVAALFSLTLAACQLTQPHTVQSAPPAASQAIRVNLKFSQPVGYSDPAFLARLAQQVDAHISYVGSIAPDTHTYRVVPNSGQGETSLMSRLSAQPGIAWAEVDGKARAAR